MNLRPRKSQIATLPGYNTTRKGMRPPRQPLVSAHAPVVATRLPPELLLMVAEYYPQISPIAVIGCHNVMSPIWRERHNVLRALSQTCRGMRDLFLPMLYEEVEACVQEDMAIPTAKFVSYVLRRQCLGLLRTPLLAAHVVSVSPFLFF